MYELSWILASVSQGLLAVAGGSVGIVGMQKRNARFLKLYSYVKLIQYILMMASCIIVMVNVSEIANRLTDEIIEQMIDDAKAKNKDPPVIDKDLLLAKVFSVLNATCRITIILWNTLGLYGLYIIHSLSMWFSEGHDPSRPRFIVSVPPESTVQLSDAQNVTPSRIQYATPLLHGQETYIPV
jgi:hypothetical protein